MRLAAASGPETAIGAHTAIVVERCSGGPIRLMTRKSLRILYAAGPGDVIGTYRHWKQGLDDPSEVAVTYSSQLFDVCRELGAEAWVISYHPRRQKLRDGPFVVEHRPLPFVPLFASE